MIHFFENKKRIKQLGRNIFVLLQVPEAKRGAWHFFIMKAFISADS